MITKPLTDKQIAYISSNFNVTIREATGNELYDSRWQFLSNSMIKYMQQDTNITRDLFLHLMDLEYVPSKEVQFIEIYNSFIASIQTIHGWKIDVEAIEREKQLLTMQSTQIDMKLSGTFLPMYKALKVVSGKRRASLWVQVTTKSARSILKRITSPVAYTKTGKPKTKKNHLFKEVDGYFYRKVIVEYVGERTDIELEYFKPNSRTSIVKFMDVKYGWKPTVLTKTFNPKMEAETFEKLKYVEAPLLVKRFKIQKQISQCNTLLDNVDSEGRIRSHVNVLGTNTGRTTSSNINMAQIDKKGKFRSFFKPNKDWVLVDSDLGGCEIVLLGKFLLPYDKGRMQEIKANADVHQSNADLAGVSRNDAKGLFFSAIYGSSGTLTGYTLWYDGCMDTNSVTTEDYDRIWKQLTKRAVKYNNKLYYPIKKDMYILLTSKLVFMTMYGTLIQSKLKDGIVGFKELSDRLARDVKSNGGYFYTLDGRRMYSKSSHSNLNYILQSSNAIYTKYWYYYISKYLRANGLKLVKDYLPLQSVYDEILHTCRPEVLPIMDKAYAWAIEQCNSKLFNNETIMEHDFQHTTDGWHKIH